MNGESDFLVFERQPASCSTSKNCVDVAGIIFVFT